MHHITRRDLSGCGKPLIDALLGGFDGNRLILTVLHSVFHSSSTKPRTLAFDEDRRYDLSRTSNCP
jgi:hypothetical protein